MSWKTEFTIHGKPKGKQRPRMAKGGFVFTPKATRDYESVVREVAATLFKEPLIGEVRLSVYAYFEIPKSWSKKKRKDHIGRHHLQTPDLDNVVKSITDGMNRIAFVDDKQVAELVCAKYWVDGPGNVRVIVEDLCEAAKGD